MYHYSLLFPKQVHDKNTYYQSAGWSKNQRQKALDWTDTVYMQLQNPLRVHNVYQYPSWLERFNGNHPEQILKMWQDIDDGKLTIEKRHHDDIDRLLSSPTYWVKRNIVKYMNKPDLLYKKVRYEIVLPIVQKLIPKRIRTLLKNLIVKT